MGKQTTTVGEALHEQAEEKTLRSRWLKMRLWFLVDGDRRLVAAVLSLTVYVATVMLGLFGPVSLRQFLFAGTLASDAFIEIQTGIFTVVTLVLTVNQLVLTPEVGSIGNQKKRLKDTLQHRETVEHISSHPTTPREATAYLHSIVSVIKQHAQQLKSSLPDEDTDFVQDITACTDAVIADAEQASNELDQETFESIRFIGSSMAFNSGGKIRELRRIKRAYADSVTADRQDRIDTLIRSLKQFETAKDYFKTSYIQSEFINFSRALMYVGLPALAIAFYTILILDETAFPGALFGIPNNLLYLGFAFAASVTPVTVLFSYVARLGALSKTTALQTPFNRKRTTS